MTDILYRLARASATLWASRRGPGALARLLARRRVYAAEFRATRRLFRKIGL